jgi:lipid-A-disaccharide synthase
MSVKTQSNYKPRCIFIIAGEASGDLHGGNLALALFKKDPTLKIIGIGGPAMKKAGVDIAFDSAQLGIVGFAEIFAKMLPLWKGYRIAKAILTTKADLLVIIDFPDFNLSMAKIAKRLGLPVAYYIGPQLWAWRKGRIKTIAERVDKMLVVFPFEEELYQKAQIPCEYVGHPLIDEAAPLLETPFSKSDYLKSKGWDAASTTLGLLPGSRESEIKRHLPVMLKGMEMLSGKIPRLQILIPVAPTISVDLIRDLTRSSPLSIHLLEGEIYSVLRASDAIVIASGTATLQAALTQTPMIIIYKLSGITHLIARFLIRLKWVGLVNIVAQTGLVPELIQDEATPHRISAEMERLLTTPSVMSTMRDQLHRVATSLGKAGASHRAADAVYDLLIKKGIS